MSQDFVFNGSVDQMLENLPIGSITKALGNNMRGINFRTTSTALPRSKNSTGYIFCTRPQLNLSTMNLSNFRGFYGMLTSQSASYQRFVRLMLDPRLGAIDGLKSPFVDENSAFIPILTNNAVSLSGFPDLTVPTYTTEAGLYGEELSMVDGVSNHYESYDLDITFKNTRGNPLLFMFYVWIKYASLVFEGILHPYLDMITENEIDYNTRIYRIVLDPTKRFIAHIAATGASFPTNVPTGSMFDFNIETPYDNKNSEISIRFRCNGFMAFDDLLKIEFNRTQAIFNKDLRKLLDHDLGGSGPYVEREDPLKAYEVPGVGLVKVPHYLLGSTEHNLMGNSFYKVNNNSYPFINLATNELEWWTRPENFK